MTSSGFSPDWIKKYSSDPYAILGVAVTADERRISKRYRQVAKQLHPDQQVDADESVRIFANQILSHLVNPAYQRLKQDKGRMETLATLRVKVRHLSRQEKLVARAPLSRQLMEADDAEVDIIYEKALTELAQPQYSSAEDFPDKTSAIAELNLIYLRRQIGAPIIREKREGLVPASETVNSEDASHGAPLSGKPTTESSPVNYAQRHISRAKAYIANKSYPKAIQELRDAVRLDPKNSRYHTMLGQAYLLQKMIGMAKVHIRQALKLDPNNVVALKYAKKLEIDLSQMANRQAQNDTKNTISRPKKRSFFKSLFKLLFRR